MSQDVQPAGGAVLQGVRDALPEQEDGRRGAGLRVQVRRKIPQADEPRGVPVRRVPEPERAGGSVGLVCGGSLGIEGKGGC